MPSRPNHIRRYKEDPEYRAKWQAYKREYNKANRHKYRCSQPIGQAERREFVKNAVVNVLTNGEGTCRMCGQGDQDVLCIDHVNNDGAVHRKVDKTSNGRIWDWMIRNDYPPGFQVLCYNCNMKKEILRRNEKRRLY